MAKKKSDDFDGLVAAREHPESRIVKPKKPKAKKARKLRWEPVKPHKPTAPEKSFITTIHQPLVDIEDGTLLVDAISHLANRLGVVIDLPDSCRGIQFNVEYHYGDYDDRSEVYLSRPETKELENPGYSYQERVYQTDLKAYEKAKAKYDEDIKLWKAQEEARIKKAEEDKEKKERKLLAELQKKYGK